MLSKLYDIVFGQDEFDKIKIDVRFDLISEVINKISIEKLEDFEILESCIYKIKDQLRVKSSNLNRIIRDPSKKLTKKKVLNILNTLDGIKYEFLKEAFVAMGKTLPEDNYNSNKEKNQLDSNLFEKENKNFYNSKNFNINTTSGINDENSKKLEELLGEISSVLSSNICDVSLEKGSIPYLLIKFRDNVDFSYISKLSTIFFESLQMDGTNIIIENLRVLIIPRFVNDNLFELPKVNSDLDNVYNTLKSNLENKQSKINIKEKNKVNDREEDNQIPKEKLPKEDYYEINDKKQDYHSDIKGENSLDSLISGIVHKKDEIHPPIRDEEKNKKEDIVFQPDEKIVFETKSKDELEEEQRRKDVIIEKSDSNNYDGNLEDKNILYQDDLILAKLEENSKVVGEIILSLKSNNNLNQATQEELTYITLFSKVFSSVVFDALQAHGSNIFWNYSEGKIHITPRFQNDNLDLTWKTKENSDDFNEQIKQKLLDRMLSEMPDDVDVESKQKNNIALQEKSNNLSNDESQRSNLNNNDKKNKSRDMTVEEKADHLLKSLRKIP